MNHTLTVARGLPRVAPFSAGHSRREPSRSLARPWLWPLLASLCATPAVADGRLFVRTQTHLYCISKK